MRVGGKPLNVCFRYPYAVEIHHYAVETTSVKNNILGGGMWHARLTTYKCMFFEVLP